MFLPTAAFLYDVAGFSLEVAARPRGRAARRRPRAATTPRTAAGPRGPAATHRRFLQGSAGWGDAVVIVPWEMYGSYGDDDVLAELWPAMVRWVDYAADAGARRAVTRPRRDAPAGSRAARGYLWDTGFHWGEWCEPGGDDRVVSSTRATWRPRSSTSPPSLVARIGRLLGHDDDAERFEDARGRRARMPGGPSTSTPTDRSTPDTQANHVRALAFGLVADEAARAHRRRASSS